MTLPVVPVPAVVLASPFPTASDRTAGIYNAKAVGWSGSENAMATRSREIALTAYENAQAAQEGAEATALDRAQTALDRVAAATAASSAVNAAGTSATSTTSLTIGTGTQTFTIQSGKAFSLGQSVVIAKTAAPGDQMIGVITAFDSASGAMSVLVREIFGAGTASAWTVSIGASPGSFGLAYSEQAATTGAVSNGQHIAFTNPDSSTVTLPDSPPPGFFVIVTVANGRKDNVINPNGESFAGVSSTSADPLTLDVPTTYQLRFIAGFWRLI